MKFRYLLLVLSSFFAGSIAIQSQTYDFSASTMPYQDLTGGIPLVNAAWDDPALEIPIGFGFKFYGDTLYNLYSLFSDIIFTDEFNDFITHVIILYGCDLIDRGYDVAAFLSPITYKTTGSPGNKVFTLEWKNAGFYNEFESLGTFTDYVNIQIKLYEESGDFVFHYGPSSIMHPELDYYNETGPAIGAVENADITLGVSLGEIIILTGSPSDPEVITTYQDVYLDGSIPANTLYRFSRNPTAVHETIQYEAEQYYNPNPCTHAVSLKSELREEVISFVSVVNSSGTLVLTDHDPDVIELDGLPPGVYELRIQTGKNQQHVQRIVVLQER